MPLEFTLSIMASSKYNAIELANRFHELGLLMSDIELFYENTGE